MTSIQDLVEKIKGYADEHRPNLRVIPDDLFLGLIIILVAFGSFGLGRLSRIEGSKTPIRIENAPEVTASTFSAPTTGTLAKSSPTPKTDTTDAQLVGSKNGTKYYFSWCSGVSNILPANIIHFSSKSDAEARGYSPSATCRGL